MAVEPLPSFGKRDPDARGYFGAFGGRFVPETLVAPMQELERAYARTGAAVLASGATAIAGFAVLVASDVRMLRDFGFVTVIDLAAALVGVLLVLPATLLLLERR